ncbi:hypothetical protein, partial [Nocardioides sp.]|uniref:hypothetical protein n=1 Tax=Nocardioides sp. TaxID=35761 RepID=UPI002736D41E
MSRVSLDLDGGERPAGPEACLQSIRMSRGAVELAAELTGVLLPWQEAPTPQRSGLEAALGPVAPPTETPRPDTAVATRELREAGLLSAATEVPRVASPLQGLLALLACGAVRVDADLVVRRRRAARGAVRLRSWHRRHHDRFAAVSTADGLEVELTWGAVAAWPGELTRLATLTPEPVP